MSLLDRIISVEGLINTLRMKVVQAMNLFKSKNVVSYKVYSALLTQSGTDAPVATILENTIGNIIWTRTSVGLYAGTLSGAFPANKTVCFGTEDEVNGNFALSIGRLDSNIVMLADYDNTQTPVGGGHMCIEIRVYTTEVAAQTIPDILGNTGKYLRTDGSTLSWDSPNIAPTLQDVLTNGSTIVSDATVNSGDFVIDIIAGDNNFVGQAGELYVGKTTSSMYAQSSSDHNSSIAVEAVNSKMRSTDGVNTLELKVMSTGCTLTQNGSTTYNLIPPKRYVALLTQSGTDAPVATVLENTLGGTVVWSRDSTGTYIGTLASSFPLGKTIALVSQTGHAYTLSAGRNSNDAVYLTRDGDSNDGLNTVPIKIEVYP